MRYDEHRGDAFFWMQLQDLARTLAREERMELGKAFYSSYDSSTLTVYLSQFWSDFPAETMKDGLKSDLLLRCVGSAYHTSLGELRAFLLQCEAEPLPKLAKALFAAGEDYRLEKLCLKLRPGTERIFNRRREVYKQYFGKRLAPHLSRGELSDVLLIHAYLLLRDPDEEHTAAAGLPDVGPRLVRLGNAVSTREVAQAAAAIMEIVRKHISRDLTTVYFSTTDTNGTEHPGEVSFRSETKRHKKLKNEDSATAEGEEHKAEKRETLSTWHRETEDTSSSLLRFDVEQGTKTSARSETVRESDSGDQALAQVQGSARAAENRSYREDSAELQRLANSEERERDRYGSANRLAVPVFLAPEASSPEHKGEYRALALGAAPAVKALQRTILQTLEHKKTSPRLDLFYGRLGKQLVRAATEPFPRLFYKKNSRGPELDAAFSLLVDCSASMHDKMEETLAGIALFHESLKALRIPHSVTGYWEDTDDAPDGTYPNFFQTVIPFESSLYTDGAAILQLQPRQDNRDGYAIRIQAEKLNGRNEKSKFLIVFSDGEPSAADYFDSGLSDTVQAVYETGRRGVEVIGIFLGKGEITEGIRDMMRHIYGRSGLLAPRLDELPALLAPVLRKLLLKALQPV